MTISLHRSIRNFFTRPTNPPERTCPEPSTSEPRSAPSVLRTLLDRYQLVPDEKRAWHAGAGSLNGQRGDVNDRSIGIEIVNNGDELQRHTEEQYVALERLAPYLAHRYKVPLTNLVGHKDTNPNKIDPSSNFDFVRIRDATTQILRETGQIP